MVRVRMSDDIRKYDTKFLGSLSKRQTFCMLIGLLLGVGFSLLLPFAMDVSILFGVIFASPVFLCGFLKINGCPFEVFALRYIYKQMLTPRKRKAKRITPLHADYLKAKKRAEQKKLAKMKPAERKKYLKKTITYSKEHVLYR